MPKLVAPKATPHAHLVARVVSMSEAVVRARELVGAVLTGDTRYTEAELDRFEALIEALDNIPQPAQA